MLNYVHRFFNIREVFHMLYLWNRSATPEFFCIAYEFILLQSNINIIEHLFAINYIGFSDLWKVRRGKNNTFAWDVLII